MANWGSSGSGAGANSLLARSAKEYTNKKGNQTSTGAYDTGPKKYENTEYVYKGNVNTPTSAKSVTPADRNAEEKVQTGSAGIPGAITNSSKESGTPSNPPASVTGPAGATKTTVYDSNGRAHDAWLLNGRTVNADGSAYSFANGDAVSAGGKYYVWENGKATPITQQQFNARMGIGTPDVVQWQLDHPGQSMYAYQMSQVGPTDHVQYMWENTPTIDEIQKMIDKTYDENIQNIKDMNQATVDKGIAELTAQLERGIADYDQQRAQSYIDQLRAANNAALRNSAAGDMGGIGQKQYSAEQNSYDQQMLSIQLQQLNLQSSINQQIAQLEAEGRFQDAQMLSEWGQQKVNALQEEFNWYEEFRLKTAYDLDYLRRTLQADAWEQETAESERAWNRGMQRLQLGIFTADDAEALGIPKEEAQALAEYYNQMAALDLQAAQADLANRTGRSSGGSGGSGGGNRGYSGNGGNPTANSGDIYDQMYALGVDPLRAYGWLVGQGYSATAAGNISGAYEALYDDMEAQQRAVNRQISEINDHGEYRGDTQGHPDWGNTIFVEGYGNVSESRLQRMIEEGSVVAYDGPNGKVFTYRNPQASEYVGGGINVQQRR